MSSEKLQWGQVLWAFNAMPRIFSFLRKGTTKRMDRITKDFIFQIQVILLENKRATVPGNLVDWMVVLGVEQRVGLNRITLSAVLRLE